MLKSDLKKKLRADFLKENEEYVRTVFDSTKDVDQVLYAELGAMAKSGNLFPKTANPVWAALQLKRIAENYIG